MYNMKNIETGFSKMLQSQRNTCSLKTKNVIENYFNELLLICVCVICFVLTCFLQLV